MNCVEADSARLTPRAWLSSGGQDRISAALGEQDTEPTNVPGRAGEWQGAVVQKSRSPARLWSITSP